MSEAPQQRFFELFNEIGIINQLATAAFNRALPDNLHVSHFAVLNHLVRLGDGSTPKQITEAFQVTKGTMTHTLNDLKSRGFIVLVPHVTDGRSKLVYLTEAGRSYRERAIGNLGPSVGWAFRDLEPDQVAEILSCIPALRLLRETLDANRNPPSELNQP